MTNFDSTPLPAGRRRLRPPRLTGRPGPLDKQAGSGWIWRWLLLGGLVVAVKLAVLALDRQPQFMFGDSAVYLVTAMEKIIPPDRSFSYGFFVRRVALKSRSLAGLIVAQTLAGIIACLALAYVLARFFKAPWPLSVTAALLSAAEPLQLVFERELMTESPTLLVLALTVVAGLAYLARPRLLGLFGFHLAGITLVSLRLGDLLYVVGGALLLPVLARLAGRLRSVVVHLGFSGLCLLLLHGGYRYAYGWLSDGPTAYLQQDGFFKLAAWAPILTPGDGFDPQTKALLAILDEPGQRRLVLRTYHRWGRDGLVERLKRLYPQGSEADRVANRIAHRAARRAPGKLLGLAWTTYLGYWRMDVDTCPVLLRDPLPAEFARWLRERFGLNTASWGTQWTPTKRFYRRSTPWFYVILLSPMLALAVLLLVLPQRRPAALFVCWAAFSIFLPFCLVNTGLSFRHLHQSGWLTLLILFILTSELVRMRSRPGPGGTRPEN